MTTERNIQFSSDRPLTDPSQDRLGYARFAEQLAHVICKVDSPEGMVIAVCGPWGSGKTSTLNFVVHYLEKMDRKERPEILRFTPWWFSGRGDVVGLFFAEIQKSLTKPKAFKKKVREAAASFFKLLAPVLKVSAPYGEQLSEVLGYLADLLDQAQQQEDMYHLKQRLADALRKEKRRLVVIVDDVDRLTAEEIRLFFQAVKAVADLPNIIYLIAYDRAVVVECLKNVQVANAEEYLEKIVQVSLELPQFDKTALRLMLSEKLDELFADSPPELFSQDHWLPVYFDGIDFFIQTPRDVARLVNSLAFNYALVRNEVNPIDMVAIEALRVFTPTVYDVVRNNETMFTGHHVSNMEAFRAFHNRWLQDLSEDCRMIVRKLLTQLFPKLILIERGGGIAADFEPKWRKQLRVCSSEIFPRYFRLTLPEGDISLEEMKIYLSIACEEGAFEDTLLRLSQQKRPDGTTRLRLFLDRLQDYAEEEIDEKCISPILQVFFDIGDDLLLPEDEATGVFDVGNKVRIGRIVHALIRRVEPASRHRVLVEAMSAGRAVSTIVREVMMLGAEHGKYDHPAVPESERLITKENLEELERLALQKISQAAEEGRLAVSPELPYTLYRWLDWDPDAAKKWVQGIVATDEGVLSLLVGFLRKSHLLRLSSGVQEAKYRLNPKWLDPFVDLDNLAGRVRQIRERADLSEMQRIALDQFIKEYELMQQGEDPDGYNED